MYNISRITTRAGLMPKASSVTQCLLYENVLDMTNFKLRHFLFFLARLSRDLTGVQKKHSRKWMAQSDLDHDILERFCQIPTPIIISSVYTCHIIGRNGFVPMIYWILYRVTHGRYLVPIK